MWYYSYPSTRKVTNLPIYFISIGKHDLQPPMIKPKGHPHDQYFYSTRGEGILKIYGKEYPIHPGDGFMIPLGIPHEYYPLGDEWDLRWMVPYGDGLADLYAKLSFYDDPEAPRFFDFKKGGPCRLKDTAPLDIILNRMHHELVHDPDYGIFTSSAMVYEYIIEFYHQILLASEARPVAPRRTDPYELCMETLRDYIDYHFMHRITMEELCEVTHVSAQHLCRIFRRCTGKRPMEYITGVRLENAKRLLLETDYSISEISYWSGFENMNYFGKLFKEKEHMTPGQFRKDGR